jgi:hypothetical protein
MSSYLQQGHDVFSKVVLREIILPRLLSLTRESRKAQGMSQGLAVKRDGHDVPGERLAVSSRAVAGGCGEVPRERLADEARHASSSGMSR